ncbi:MAG: hypothetical protein HQL25_03365 [Candidatus Omnitrophica bacterium]|nr:hypothetical protein [Candidatus Omnitrophota bacterium]
MQTKNKLTLWVESDLASFGKDWAKQHGRSLSNIVTEYLIRLKASAIKEKKVSPLVRRMSGILSGAPPTDIRATYRKHLENKHARA